MSWHTPPVATKPGSVSYVNILHLTFTFLFFLEGGGAEGGEVGVGVAVQYLKVFLEFLDIFSANFQIVQGNLEKMSMNIQNCQVRILFQKNMPSPKTGTCDEVPY